MNPLAPGTDVGVRAEACAWLAQLESGNLTRDDVATLREWMHRSPRHAAELRQLARLSRDLNVLTELAAPLRAAQAQLRPLRRRRLPVTAWRWLAVASSLAVVTLAAVLLFNQLTSAPPWTLALATDVGERREATLPDGSVIALNTDGQLDVRYATDVRQVRLLRGEALFTVAHDAQRPFIVSAGGRQVRAVGTAFVVRVHSDLLEVAVTDGQVQVSAAAVDGDAGQRFSGTVDPRPVLASARVQVGEQIALPLAGRQAPASVQPLSKAQMRRRLAWREGLLDFADTPLEDVVAEVGRYTQRRIVIADPELRRLRFDGLFRTGEIEPLLGALQSAFGIDVQMVDATTVALTRRQALPMADSAQERY